MVALKKTSRDCWSFRKLGDKTRAFANGLAKAGFKRGDSVALFAENRLEWMAAALGAIRAGAVAVPLDVQLSDDDLAHILDDSDAHAVITTSSRAARLEKLRPQDRPRLILLDAAVEDERSWKRYLPNEQFELPTLHANDVAVLFYTSGTTGPPKGVPLTHGNIGSQLEAIPGLHLIDESDRVLLPLPLHHVYPFVIGMLAPLFLGVPIVLPFSLLATAFTRTARI